MTSEQKAYLQRHAAEDKQPDHKIWPPAGALVGVRFARLRSFAKAWAVIEIFEDVRITDKLYCVFGDEL